jgi:hypothetical protein
MVQQLGLPSLNSVNLRCSLPPIARLVDPTDSSYLSSFGRAHNQQQTQCKGCTEL